MVLRGGGGNEGMLVVFCFGWKFRLGIDFVWTRAVWLGYGVRGFWSLILYVHHGCRRTVADAFVSSHLFPLVTTASPS